MLHTVFIGLHAATGVVALVAGALALPRGRFFEVYLWSLVGMLGFLVLAVAVEWGQNDSAQRVLFSALTVLAVVMVARAWRARYSRPTTSTGPSHAYVHHVGFTLIALVDAFVVVTVLNAGAPVWLVVAAGVVVGVIGHFALGHVWNRLAAAGAASTAGVAADVEGAGQIK